MYLRSIRRILHIYVTKYGTALVIFNIVKVQVIGHTYCMPPAVIISGESPEVPE